jgi:3',5'-cyclic-AMP phosphodiesterase
MKFIHLTDLHLVPADELLWGISPIGRLRAALTDIVRHHRDAEFCVITGDLTERGDVAGYEMLKQEITQFPIQTFLLIGNHDDRSNYFKVFGQPNANGFVQQSFVRGPHHFLCLDTLKGGLSSAGLLDGARRDWLKEHLIAAKGAPVYIFMHHPPFKIHHPLMDLIPLDDGEGFGDILQGHNVRHIFFGHAHRMISGQWRGISYSALPSLAHQLPLVGGAVSTVYSDEPPMYGVVYIEGAQITVHSDAFLNRTAAVMSDDAERGTWY